jgi:hypothetical protein
MTVLAQESACAKICSAAKFVVKMRKSLPPVACLGSGLPFLKAIERFAGQLNQSIFDRNGFASGDRNNEEGIAPTDRDYTPSDGEGLKQRLIAKTEDLLDTAWIISKARPLCKEC